MELHDSHPAEVSKQLTGRDGEGVGQVLEIAELSLVAVDPEYDNFCRIVAKIIRKRRRYLSPTDFTTDRYKSPEYDGYFGGSKCRGGMMPFKDYKAQIMTASQLPNKSRILF